MHLREAMYLGLALLVAASLSVCGSAASATGTASKTRSKSSTSSTGSKTRKSSSKSKKSRRKERGQQAPTPDRISEIQTALSKDGSFRGTPNGKWDDATVGAMRSFQTSHGLTPNGKLDAPTLQKLGLGSQTAGVAAPIVPPNSTSRLISSSSTAQSSRE
jgi:peptidoglycan hydrolase-like protein with peptidoglycan-binding domain